MSAWGCPFSLCLSFPVSDIEIQMVRRHCLAPPVLSESPDSFLPGQWLRHLPGTPGIPPKWGPAHGGEVASPPTGFHRPSPLSFLSQERGCPGHSQPWPQRKPSGRLLLKVSWRPWKHFPACIGPHKYAFSAHVSSSSEKQERIKAWPMTLVFPSTPPHPQNNIRCYVSHVPTSSSRQGQRDKRPTCRG